MASWRATASRMQRSSIARSSPAFISPRSTSARAFLISAGGRRLPTWSARKGGAALGLIALPLPGTCRERAPVDHEALGALQKIFHQREHALGLIDLDRVRGVPDVYEIGPRQAALQKLDAFFRDHPVGGAVQDERELVDRRQPREELLVRRTRESPGRSAGTILRAPRARASSERRPPRADRG